MKKEEKSVSKALEKLREDIKGGHIGCAYIFHGEESYLREHYLQEIRESLIPPGFEEFNFHKLEGSGLTAERLAEIAETIPMMTERTLITVTDWDIFKLGEEQQNKLIALFSDIPPYCCMVFIYSTIAYKRNRSMKELCAAMTDTVEEVEFRAADTGSLLPWIARQFRAREKSIDRQTSEYLVFMCGSLMVGLLQEIEKISAYTQKEVVTQEDIDAVAEPVLSASTFNLTDMIIQGHYDRAAEILGNLLKMQTEPRMILAALGYQLRHLYTARMAIDSGFDKRWLAELWEMKSDYQAMLLLRAAKGTTQTWCADALKMCQRLDCRIKRTRGCDEKEELTLLLTRLGAIRK